MLRMSSPELQSRDRFALFSQNLVSLCCAPLTMALLSLIVRFKFKWSIRNHRTLRRQFRDEIRQAPGPVMICANHLTMVDSILIQWAIAPTWWYLLHFKRVPWNVPERKNFAGGFLPRTGAYLAKCIPVIRGGDRLGISLVLNKLRHLLAHHHVVLMFPEGGRSRTGRVDATNPALGTGRVIKGLPDARVLCVYLRGDHQENYSNLPIPGERFYCETSWLQPHTTSKGLRGSVEISKQIINRIQTMEEHYLRTDGRK